MRPMMAMLLGGRSGVYPSLSGVTIADFESYPDSALASITFKSDGSITYVGTVTSGSAPSRWLVGSTNGAAYDVYVTPSGDDTFSPGSSDTVTALQLNADRTFRVTRASHGTKSCEAIYEIRLTGTGSALVSATKTLSADVS